jgi:hypothetical protein
MRSDIVADHHFPCAIERYFTFGEPGLANALKEVYAFLREKRVTVGA